MYSLGLFVMRVSAFFVGSVLIYLAVFLYEDEQGRIQNTLEELWLKIDARRQSTASQHVSFMRAIALTVSIQLDRFLGPRLFSVQSIGVSICCSVVSAIVVGHIFFLGKWSWRSVCFGFLFLILAALPS